MGLTKHVTKKNNEPQPPFENGFNETRDQKTTINRSHHFKMGLTKHVTKKQQSTAATILKWV